jgi:hypothetical protein
VTGFDYMVTNNSTRYFVIDTGAVSRIVTLDENWTYLTSSVLPYPYTYSLKLNNNGYFYLTSDKSFYRMNMNVYSDANYTVNYLIGYRQFFFDSNSQSFYVAPFNTKLIQLFDLNCVYIRNISLQNNSPYGLNVFNDNIYVSTTANQILIVSKSTEQIIKQVNCDCSNDWLYHITIDLFGFMVISAHSNKICLLDRTNVSYTGNMLATSNTPWATTIIPNGRFVLMASNSIDIYF